MRIVLGIVLAFVCGLALGCKREDLADARWTTPKHLFYSKDSLDPEPSFFKWNGHLLILKWSDDYKSATWLVLQDDGNSWKEGAPCGLDGAKLGADAPLTADQGINRLLRDCGFSISPDIPNPPTGVLCISATRSYTYLFTSMFDRHELLAARKRSGQKEWGRPETLVKTFVTSAWYTKVIAVGEGDTLHVCWLDRRHEKKRLNPVYPNRANYKVAYRQRKDSDSTWGKEVILSQGLLYGYSPSLSVEGDRIVVAWAGVKSAADWHSEYSPSQRYLKF